MLIDGDKSNMETNQYKIRLKELNELYNIGKKVSLVSGSKRAATIKFAQAEKVVEKVLLHCNSIIKLFNVGQNEYSELDIALIASATRNIMDAANVYFYISERGISAEESNFRYNLQLLNYNKNIKDIYNKLNFPMDCFRMKLDDMSFVIEEIKSSSIYLTANNKEKSIILSGKQFYNRKRVRIFSQELESAIFNILSNSTHSFYIGLSNNSVEKSLVFSSYIDSLMLSIISVETSIIYTANIINDYLLLRRQLSKIVTQPERIRIKDLMKIDYISNYLEFKKSEFAKDIF